MVRPALVLPPEPDERWELAKQVGVTDAVIHPLEIGDGRTRWTYDDLRGLINWLEADGLSLSVIEGSVPLTDRIRLGLDGRDDDIAEFERFLRDCGELDVPVVAYDWMAGVRWARTEAHIESRGGSLVTGFDERKVRGGPESVATEATHEDLWDAFEYFIGEVGPVAEEAGVKLALHPDDPPRSDLRGIPRIATSVEAYDRVLDAYDSEYNGITFCQGNFAAMGADIPDAIRHFGDRINFVHFRDVEGDADRFVETWHDDGPTDMAAAIRAYRDVGFDGPMRPDHVPTMAGEDNHNPGYHTNGRLFAIGYMKGLLEATTD
ncbi:Mannonate dehydratase [Haladaptatus paucihalophilus DX253]|uniref:mannonate dehydratase n=1 Tax=Haladaptatus paucihalophilus DX253 TaxID=797209 RepID=E7QWI1_HALPU|nr:mannonate dehydratase [Haladaptatus paucihalophilus]EFW91077.1 Mannonate dehydratase [Haladaptatus paucihalophilus DX253]SHL37948.1 mannonate dehydratase [Haladaptatus paucihalophilus DX253]